MIVNSCLINLACSTTISASGGANGIGVSFSFASGKLWSGTQNYLNTCAAQTAPTCYPNPATPPYTPPSVGTYYWDYSTCQYVFRVCQGSICFSPIIIDTDGSGFHLTSANDGVQFDFFGNGSPVQLAWTAKGTSNGWLALDRDGNDTINSAKELFGNITEQPPSDEPNGFLALAMFDANHDGVIDGADPIWAKLLVWIDANHDGISQPAELHHMDELGIKSISLKYKDSQYTDEFGNRFRYKGHLLSSKSGVSDHVIYDVFLSSR